MKLTQLAIIGAIAIASASPIHVPAIEGLKLAVQCPDVILSWPSVEGETYIVQCRQPLSTNAPWVTLADWLPAQRLIGNCFWRARLYLTLRG
jgi:hypothetical protein